MSRTLDQLFEEIQMDDLFVIGLGKDHGGYACYVGDEAERILSGWTKAPTPQECVARALEKARAARTKRDQKAAPKAKPVAEDAGVFG